MANTHARKLLLGLSQLEKLLDDEFARGHVFYEADVHHLVVCHLRRVLEQKSCRLRGHRWIIGSKHQVWGLYPDVLFYAVPRSASPSAFLEDTRDFLVGVMEIKFRHRIGSDLRKMEKLAKKHWRRSKKKLATWFVYGDHFEMKVHARNYMRQEARAKKVEEWAKDSELRGCSILRVGVTKKHDDAEARRWRKAFNDSWWAHDIPEGMSSGS
jgi:hypothetical protein